MTKSTEASSEPRASFTAVVHVLLTQTRWGNREVLLLRRANTGFMDGYYAPPGGHVENGELPLEAALRECEEEAGVVVPDLAPLAVMPYVSGAHQGFNFLFGASAWVGQPRIAEPRCSDVLCWVPTQHLPAPHAGWLDEALALVQDDAWYAEQRYTVKPNQAESQKSG